MLVCYAAFRCDPYEKYNVLLCVMLQPEKGR